MFTHHLARLMFFMGFGLSVLSCSAQEGENVTLQFLSFPKSLDPKPVELLLGEGKDNADGMELIPIANDVANFGGSKFLFMNAAKVNIVGEAGGVKFVVKPGNHTVIEPKADTTGLTFHAMFYFRKDNEAKPFFSSK